jgi:tRNA-modifying protein YgfZ
MKGPYRLERALIRVSGPDARGFLNNLLTQNVEKLVESGVQFGALLSPQGKLIADMLAWADGDGIVLEVDPARGVELLRRLTMFKLRAAISLEDITGRFRLLWAPELFRGGQPDPRFPQGELGWRELSSLPPERYEFPDGAAVYDSHRLKLGVPELARDAAPEEVFALEALLEELHGVDFQKGCFVGQENVSRMKRRATTRRKFCPIVFEGEAPRFATPMLAGDSEIGTVRGGAHGRAMALVRLDRALEAAERGRALSADGRPVRLDPPPWLILPQRDGEAD